MPRHRGKSKKSCGRGPVWSGRKAKERKIKLVGETKIHRNPCGNYACDRCYP